MTRLVAVDIVKAQHQVVARIAHYERALIRYRSMNKLQWY